MNKTEDILSRAGMRKRSYQVPQGYFDTLRSSLYLIPQRQETSEPQTAPHGRRAGMLTWALSALCAIAVVAVSLGLILKSPGRTDVLSYEQLLVADLIPHTTGFEEYYYGFEESISEEISTQDDLYDYLISGGTSTTFTSDETDY